MAGSAQYSARTVAFCVAGVLLAAFAWEVLPAAWLDYSVLQPEVSQRSAFADAELPDLMRKYPAFMPRLGQENNDIANRGAWAPVIQRAFERFTLVRLVGSVAQWLGNNFLLRLMSPQNTWEFVGVLALLAVALLVCAVMGWGACNLLGSWLIARTMRANRRQVAFAASAGASKTSSLPAFGGGSDDAAQLVEMLDD